MTTHPTAPPRRLDTGVPVEYLKQMGRRRRRAVRVRNVRKDLLTLVGWTTVAAAVATYLADRGEYGWSSAVEIFTSLGVLSGLVGTALMVIMFWLAARIPVVDQAIGHDRALGRHSNLGAYMLTGLMLHAIFLTTAWALADKLTLFQGLALMWDVSDIALGIVSLGLVLVVMVSSIVAAKRKLGQEAWHLIHLTTYVAMGLAIPHQFSVGGVFAQGWTRIYWIAMFVATGVVMAYFRVITPIRRSLKHRLVVTDIRPAASTNPAAPGARGSMVTITMTGRHLHDLDARAGQFFTWRFWSPRLWWHPHPFSISAAPDGRTLRITVRDLGRGTNALLRHLRRGMSVSFEGPYGMFTDQARTRDAVVLMGSGVGIAPIRAVLEGTETLPGRSVVVLRASRPEELVHLDEIQAICAHRGVQLITLVGPRGRSWEPRSQLGLRLVHLAPWIANADLYVCGPQPWTDAVVSEALASGLSAAQIHDERFSW